MVASTLGDPREVSKTNVVVSSITIQGLYIHLMRICSKYNPGSYSSNNSSIVLE